jgi:hypothetical protein
MLLADLAATCDLQQTTCMLLHPLMHCACCHLLLLLLSLFCILAGMPDGVDAFQGNVSLLLQLRSTAAAVAAAEADAAAADALLASSQAAGQAAEAAAEEAAQEEAAAEQQLAVKTPAALARAQALTSVLGPMVEAAEAALTLVTGGTGSTLRALQTLVEKNSAARDLAPITSETLAQHQRCVAVLQRLHGIGAAAAAGLQEALLLNQQQQQEVQQEQGGEQQQQQRRLLELLLQHMSPALQGVKNELHELGQVSILVSGTAAVAMELEARYM